MDERGNADDNDTVPFSVCHGVVECFCSDEFIVLKWPLRPKENKTRNRKHRRAAAKPVACARNAVNTSEQGKEGGRVR